jgi:hypothetical protein
MKEKQSQNKKSSLVLLVESFDDFGESSLFFILTA